jgi:hypothetical protein
MTDYWIRVLKGALDNTLRPMRWSRESFAAQSIAILTVLFAGGFAAFLNLVSQSVAIITATTLVAIGLFLWGIIETQFKVYLQMKSSRDELTAEIDKRQSQNPDFAKWRHREKLTLAEAAHLWSNMMPQQFSLKGDAKQSYEMLRGGVQKGELEIDTSDVPNWKIEKTLWEDPRSDTVVTRDALKKFAGLYHYDPEFLRDPS